MNVNKSLIVAVVLVSAALTAPAGADDANLVRLLKEAAVEMQKLATRVKSLEDQLKGAQTVPQGAVVAFDRAKGCPGGWSEFNEGAGRFIIGVDGKGFTLPYIKEKPQYVIGGKATTVLEERHLPPHTHSINAGRSTSEKDWYGLRYDAQSGFVERVIVANTPEKLNTIKPSTPGQEHTNMPPYIALYFCKKD